MVSQKVKNLKYVFEPKSIAIIGASREPGKIGNVILKNFLDSGFLGKIYPVNPKAETIMGIKCYKSVKDIKEPVESAIISIPAKFVPSVVQECADKGIKGIVVISGGFSEIGNYELEEQVKEIANKYDIALIGPNCMGVLNPKARVDSIFLPTYKLERPKVGSISFLSQSGALGGCIIDLNARSGLGMAKFVSYGNAAVIDEADLIEYFLHDKKTKIIAMYLEGVKDGKKFLQIAKKTTIKKPIIAIKAGVGKKAAQATKSHTGSMAGSSLAYKAAFKQARVVEAKTLEDLFDFTKIFTQPKISHKRIAVVTNGGGMGVLAVDSIEENGLELAELSDESKQAMKEFMPSYSNISNPVDLIGDADAFRYEKALRIVLKDKNVDAVVVIVLFQTASIDSRIINILVKASEDSKKPIVVVATGGEYTELHRRILDANGVPTYPSPSSAIRSLSRLIEYYKKIKYCELDLNELKRSEK